MLSRCHTKRPAYLMPISPGPGVTQVEAFREIKGKVSWTAPHNAAKLTAVRTEWSIYVKWMLKWRKEKERRSNGRCIIMNPQRKEYFLLEWGQTKQKGLNICIPQNRAALRSHLTRGYILLINTPQCLLQATLAQKLLYGTKERVHAMTASQKCTDTPRWHAICPHAWL